MLDNSRVEEGEKVCKYINEKVAKKLKEVTKLRDTADRKILESVLDEKQKVTLKRYNRVSKKYYDIINHQYSLSVLTAELLSLYNDIFKGIVSKKTYTGYKYHNILKDNEEYKKYKDKEVILNVNGLAYQDYRSQYWQGGEKIARHIRDIGAICKYIVDLPDLSSFIKTQYKKDSYKIFRKIVKNWNFNYSYTIDDYSIRDIKILDVTPIKQIDKLNISHSSSYSIEPKYSCESNYANSVSIEWGYWNSRIALRFKSQKRYSTHTISLGDNLDTSESVIVAQLPDFGIRVLEDYIAYIEKIRKNNEKVLKKLKEGLGQYLLVKQL